MSDRFQSNTAPRELENPHNPCYSEHLEYEYLWLRFSGTPITQPMITCFVTMRCNHHHGRQTRTDDLHDFPQGAKLDRLVSCRGDQEHVEVVGDYCQ